MIHHHILSFFKKKIYILCAIALVLGASLATEGKVSTPVKIAALVDGSPIFIQEVKNRAKLMTLGNPATPDEEQQRTLEQKALRLIINEMLQMKETDRLEIVVEPEEIQQYVKYIEDQNHWPEGQLKKMLAEGGVPESTFEKHIKANIAWMKLISQLKILANIDDTHVEDTLKHASHRKQTKYLLGEIVLYFENDSEEEEQRQLANQISEELHKGAPFNLVAQQYSMSSSAARGGDVDWIDEDQLEPEVQKAIKDMPQNSITHPIKLRDKFTIIALRSKQAVGQDGMEDVYKIRELDIPFPAGMSLQHQENEIKRFEALVKNAKNCNEFSALADSIPGATLQIHESVSTKSMTPEFQKITESLAESQVSPPTVIEKKGVAFFMLCSKTREKISEFKSDDIKEIMMKQKMEAIGEKRLRDIQRRSHIEIRL